jgi:AcrR family transcriptional regulator
VSPKPNDPDATRQAIVVSAHGMMARFGSKRMTIEDVARAAGLSRPTIYAYFEDKQALIDAVLMWNGHLIREELQRRFEQAPTFADKVTVAAKFGAEERSALRYGEQQPDDLALLLTTQGEPWIRRATSFWEPIVREAQAAGEIRPDLPPRATANWVARSLFALAVIKSGPSGDDAAADGEQTDIEFFARIYLAGGLA